jgi:hypothetical protein
LCGFSPRFRCHLLPTKFLGNPLQNKPLMARFEHWKSSLVLPTFQLSAIGARPRFSTGDARPTWRAFTRLDMPIWMKC